MFTDKVELKDFEKMDPEYQDLLKRVLAIQCDCEIGGPHLYIEDMLPNAPTKLDQLVVARTAAEELDHYRKMARLAGDVGEDVSYVLSWPNQKRYVEAFRGKITTWEDFAVFGFLIDRVGSYQLEEFEDCSYVPLAAILPTMKQEEVGHIDYGTNLTREMATKDDESKERVQKSIDYWYVKGLDMFGRDGVETLRTVPLLGAQAAHQPPTAGGVHRGGQRSHHGHGSRYPRSQRRAPLHLRLEPRWKRHPTPSSWTSI